MRHASQLLNPGAGGGNPNFAAKLDRSVGNLGPHHLRLVRPKWAGESCGAEPLSRGEGTPVHRWRPNCPPSTGDRRAGSAVRSGDSDLRSPGRYEGRGPLPARLEFWLTQFLAKITAFPESKVRPAHSSPPVAIYRQTPTASRGHWTRGANSWLQGSPEQTRLSFCRTTRRKSLPFSGRWGSQHSTSTGVRKLSRLQSRLLAVGKLAGQGHPSGDKGNRTSQTEWLRTGPGPRQPRRRALSAAIFSSPGSGPRIRNPVLRPPR